MDVILSSEVNTLGHGLNHLLEIPDEWRERLTRWRRLNRKNVVVDEGQAIPGPNEEYLL